jgi:hypothetical protein
MSTHADEWAALQEYAKGRQRPTEQDPAAPGGAQDTPGPAAAVHGQVAAYQPALVSRTVRHTTIVWARQPPRKQTWSGLTRLIWAVLIIGLAVEFWRTALWILAVVAAFTIACWLLRPGQ